MGGSQNTLDRLLQLVSKYEKERGVTPPTHSEPVVIRKHRRRLKNTIPRADIKRLFDQYRAENKSPVALAVLYLSQQARVPPSQVERILYNAKDGKAPECIADALQAMIEKKPLLDPKELQLQLLRRPWATVDEAAEYLLITPSEVRKHIRIGTFAQVRHECASNESYYLISRDDLRAYRTKLASYRRKP